MSQNTLFLRLTGLPKEEKAAGLEATLAGTDHPLRFQAEANSFELVPGAPFAYWVSEAVRQGFQKLPSFESTKRTAKVGLQTSDDKRFVRLWWEPRTNKIGHTWHPFAKGGSYSPLYSDVYLLVKCVNNFDENVAYTNSRYEYLNGNARSLLHADVRNFFRPGLTWPLRTQKGLGLRAMPAGCAFGHKGPAAFVDGDDPEALLALLATTTSAAFRGLVGLQMAFGSYEVGVIQRTPVPPLPPAAEAFLAQRARAIWALRQHRDQVEETSHAFVLPALLMAEGENLRDRTEAWAQRLQTDDREIQRLQSEIDAKCWELYGIAEADRQALMDPGALACASDESSEGESEGEEEAEEASSITPEALAEDLTSWLFGVALGRWDAGLATCERSIPPLPGPFDQLPAISRGMLSGADGLHPAKDATGRFIPEHDLLLDDEGENHDLVRRVREVLERVAGEQADAWLLELEGLIGNDLRTWYRRTFFERHLKRYSKSRRKAPIYWQLGTPSGSYSVWLYYPRLTRDSIFRLLNDVVKPKVAYEEQRLAGLREQNARRSELEPQEALVEELQAFRDEVARVTPLFDPNLDDGVLINAAPLHRLFVHAGWRRDTQAAWTQLVRGDFEWSHMALHLWPERVVPQCAEQRHLALAHDLEGPLKTRSVEDLVAAHTRPAVKDGLQTLLNASPQAGGRSAGRSARASRPPRPAPEPRAAAEPTPRAPRTSAEVPEATLATIREVLARFPGGAAKSDVLAATGLPDGTWNTAIAQLLATGDVERQGEKRGTRYFLVRR